MTGTSPGRRSGKVPAAGEMPGIPDEAGSYVGIIVLSLVGQIPPDDREWPLITSLNSQLGPDASRHAGTCPTGGAAPGRCAVRGWEGLQALPAAVEELFHGRLVPHAAAFCADIT